MAQPSNKLTAKVIPNLEKSNAKNLGKFRDLNIGKRIESGFKQIVLIPLTLENSPELTGKSLYYCNYSNFAPDCCTTLPHLLASVAINLERSFGLPGAGSKPPANSRDLSSGLLRV